MKQTTQPHWAIQAGKLTQLDAAGRPIKNYRAYTRNELLGELPNIVDALVKEAQKGSAAHIKQLLQISGIDRELKAAPLRTGKAAKPRSLADMILDELRQQHALPAETETKS